MDSMRSLIEDFDVNIPRVLVSGAVAIIDNVKKIIILSDSNLTVDYGKGKISVYGTDICVESIYDSRISVSGNFAGVEIINNDDGKEVL